MNEKAITAFAMEAAGVKEDDLPGFDITIILGIITAIKEIFEGCGERRMKGAHRRANSRNERRRDRAKSQICEALHMVCTDDEQHLVDAIAEKFIAASDSDLDAAFTE